MSPIKNGHIDVGVVNDVDDKVDMLLVYLSRVQSGRSWVKVDGPNVRKWMVMY